MRISVGTLALAWVVAFAFVAVASIAISHAGKRRVEAVFAGQDVVFIGTSLMRYALPLHGVSQPMPPVDADSALRVALGGGSESELLDLTAAAAAAGVGTVFVEVNPIVSRFSDASPPCSLWSRLAHRRERLRIFANAVLRGREIIPGGVKPPRNERTRHINPDRLERLYPLHFDVPCNPAAWQQIAHSSDTTRIILVVMPRDREARDFIGADAMADFETAAQAFASTLDLALFTPDVAGSWGEDHFLDQAHVSQLGATRFQQELGTWWSAQK